MGRNNFPTEDSRCIKCILGRGHPYFYFEKKFKGVPVLKYISHV